jgi:nucleoside 2-deoxyribosyltransferase
VVIANLNDFHGWEPDSDTAFECGMGYQLGKALYGYMDDTRPMIERIPNLGPEQEYRDACGCNAENFNYPINLMFSGSMPIYEGKFEQVIERIAKEIRKN